ncbi:MAG: hypothetical protein LC674_02585 [Actinobacteria bacterium]|nr:hypothetical protein [Actinomycetota bacterium]
MPERGPEWGKCVFFEKSEAILTIVATKATVGRTTSKVVVMRAKDGLTKAEVGLIEPKVRQAIIKSVSTRLGGSDTEAEEISTIPEAGANQARIVIGKGKVVEEKA